MAEKDTTTKLEGALSGASAQNPTPAGSTDAKQPSSKVDFTSKLHSSSLASDANRDQNFDGTLQKGKDTMTDGIQRRVVPTDASAESSQLTVNEMIGSRAAGPAGNPAVTISPGSAMIVEGTGPTAPTKYYRSSIPSFNFRPRRHTRVRFENYWLKTNDQDVQFYIEHQLMRTGGTTRITIEDEAKFNEERSIYGNPNTIVNPEIRPLPNQTELDARKMRQVALHAKAPRTDHNPDLIEPETGNAQQDHMTQFKQTQTDDLNRPVVDDRIGPTEAQRAVQERNAIGGAPPAKDSKANTPLPNSKEVKQP